MTDDQDQRRGSLAVWVGVATLLLAAYLLGFGPAHELCDQGILCAPLHLDGIAAP